MVPDLAVVEAWIPEVRGLCEDKALQKEKK